MATVYVDQITGVSTSPNPVDAITGNGETLAYKAPCRVATTGNITLSGAQTIDGVAVVSGDRVLVRAQTNSVDNGIWIVSSGVWSRARDFDSNRDVTKGTRVTLTDGSTLSGKEYMISSSNPIQVGTSNIIFTETLSSDAGSSAAAAQAAQAAAEAAQAGAESAETAAGDYASAASTSAGNAATSESNAAASASDASGYASAASGYASAASTSAGNAATAETNAETAETNAEAAQAAAELAQAAAEAAAGSIDTAFLLNRANHTGTQLAATISNFSTAADARVSAAMIDEDDMASNSATKVPTQQSVKAYVDANAGGSLPSLDQGTILGRHSGGTGDPEQVTLGPGLGIAGGALYQDLTQFGALSLEMSEDRGTPVIAGPQGGGFYDGFGVLTYVDTAGATNLETSETGVLKPASGGSSTISLSGLTNITDFNDQVANAYNGNANETGANSARKTTNSLASYIGKDLGSGNAKRIAGGTITSSNNNGFAGSGITNVTINLRGSNTSPGSGSAGTLLGTTGSFADGTSTLVKDITSTDTTNTYRYVWYELVATGSAAGFTVAECEFDEALPPGDLSVESETRTLAEQPDFAQIIAFVEKNDAAVNTDLIFAVSRDDGATFLDVAMTELYARIDGSVVLSSGIVDLSGEAAGTEGRWQVRTDNGKAPRILGVGDLYGVFS